MLAQVVGHFQFCSLQNAEELQGVDDGFALVVVVGDHVNVSGVFLNFLDARDPGIQFVERIEIVVAFVGGEFGIVAEPGVIAAAVEADVACGRGALRGWRDGIADDGLIDIAEAGVVIAQEIESGLRLPGGVAEFDDEGIVCKSFEQGGEMGGGFRRFVKGERELEEHGAELACIVEDIKTCACRAFVVGGGGRFVGEALPEFGGEEERGVCCYALDPGGSVVGSNWVVEGSVDFDGVEKLGEECCFVKAL